MNIAVARDLRPMFGPVRHQGARPTCLAFAASDLHAALRDGWTPLSTEFAFYCAQRRAGRSPYKGAILGAMLDALRDDGQPAETAWPYLASLPKDLSTWAPPASSYHLFRRAGEKRDNRFDEIISLLDDGRPSLVLLMLSDAFYEANPGNFVIQKTGEMPDPLRRHAVIVVAHGMLGNARAILVRNSWGNGWGLNGHAWITEAFLVPRLIRVAILTEEVNVPTH
ncbi:MAG: C1 family peptidase [Alphaproteobacteria bacterium]